MNSLWLIPIALIVAALIAFGLHVLEERKNVRCLNCRGPLKINRHLGVWCSYECFYDWFLKTGEKNG